MINFDDVSKLAKLLSEKCPRQEAFLSIPVPDYVPDDGVEGLQNDIKALGYHSMLRETALGFEIVVTDKVPDADP